MEDQDDICTLNCEKNNISLKNSTFLAMFSSGCIKKKDIKKIKFRSFENSQTPDGLNRKRIRKILVADCENLQYCGHNYGTQASQRGDHNRYYIGVRSKKTGVMTVHGVQLINCTPMLNTTVLNDDEDEDLEKTYTEKMDMLTSAFGSKRKRQAMESRLNYGKGNSDGGNAVADSVDVANLRQHNTSVNEATGPAQAIPPQNGSATVPSEVYDLKDIISVEEYFALEPHAKILTEATPAQVQQWKSQSTYTQLVLQCLQCSRSSVDLNKAKLLVYYDFVTQMLHVHYKDVRKKDPLPNIPEPFKRKLLECFTLSGSTEHGGTTRSMPLSMKDKVMTYAMVLALFIEDYEVDLQTIQKDFKKSQAALVKIANALGCTVISKKLNGVTEKIAKLKLPLFVPVSKPSRRKK